jgi:hypothetical protein
MTVLALALLASARLSAAAAFSFLDLIQLVNDDRGSLRRERTGFEVAGVHGSVNRGNRDVGKSVTPDFRARPLRHGFRQCS